MYNINELAPWIRSLTSKISLLLFFVFCFSFFLQIFTQVFILKPFPPLLHICTTLEKIIIPSLVFFPLFEEEVEWWVLLTAEIGHLAFNVELYWQGQPFNIEVAIATFRCYPFALPSRYLFCRLNHLFLPLQQGNLLGRFLMSPRSQCS